MKVTNTRDIENLKRFRDHLVYEEKSDVTTEKYCRDAAAFCRFADDRPITKELVIAYKDDLIGRDYAVRSINSMIASVNSYLRFLGKEECRVKILRTQQEVYCPEEKVLTKEDYLRLLEAAKGHPRMYLLLQTICATGIRVSELSSFTVDAVNRGEVRISCKSKIRVILIPEKLREMLLSYARDEGIREGVIFRTKSGNPLNRSNIWHDMKSLCRAAKVPRDKVFPHNLRKLFARTYYSADKDIARLADLLGHSSINTTRIYIISSGAEHKKKLEQMGLLYD